MIKVQTLAQLLKYDIVEKLFIVIAVNYTD